MAKTESKTVVATVAELKAAREALKTKAAELKAQRELVKTLAEKVKTEKTEARTKRMAERKAKLQAALKKLETVGKGAAKAKRETRKPGPVQIIKPAE